MGLRCSLFGHRFGDPATEHDREERESEVVTTTREVAVCERCGEERVLSENKEVTVIAEATPEGGEHPHDEGDGAVDAPAPDDGTAPSGTPDGSVDPADEDAEIIEDGPAERGFGEWPTEGDERSEPWDPDAPLREDDDETEASPGVETDGDGDHEPTVAAAAGEDTVEDAGGEDTFEETTAHDEGPTRLVCSSCGFETTLANSPLRDGDACPDCNAYLSAE